MEKSFQNEVKDEEKLRQWRENKDMERVTRAKSLLGELAEVVRGLLLRPRTQLMAFFWRMWVLFGGNMLLVLNWWCAFYRYSEDPELSA